MTDFAGLAPPLARALAARGYDSATPVQAAVLDPALEGADLLVSARTGSGKTVAFGMAIARTLLAGDGDDPLPDDARFGPAGAPLALAIAPTRELAVQVRRELEWLYAETGAALASSVGGMDPRSERRALERGAHIVVGTPGRLRDHIDRGALDVTAIRAVVLDEADEMLDLGFREDLEFILAAMPESRRTLMFSATVPREIERLAKRFQRDARRVSTVDGSEQHADIDYRALLTASRETDNAVLNVLRYYEARNALVFCNTRAAVARMTARLANRGFRAVSLSGELSQAERTHALQALRDGRARVCVATDVAARGIDLPGLELVVHAELPNDPQTLLHRSGRTGRAGAKGVSALVVDVRGRNRALRLLRAAGLDATWANPPSADEVLARDEERMLADPAFTEPTNEGEAETVARLLERFTPEQVATAHLRLLRAGRSAPEEVEAVPLDRRAPERGTDGVARERPARPSFASSAWFALSVGRRQNAEPRWLIPMLCNNSALNRRDIGAIRMRPNETDVEIDATRADAFIASLGPDMTVEKTRVRALEDAPSPDAGEPDAPGARKPRPKAKHDGVPEAGHKEGHRGGPKDGRSPKPYREAAGEGGKPRPKPKKPKKPKAKRLKVKAG